MKMVEQLVRFLQACKSEMEFQNLELMEIVQHNIRSFDTEWQSCKKLGIHLPLVELF